MADNALMRSKCTILAMILLTSSLFVAASATEVKAYTYGDFDYKIIYGVNIEISGYHGNGGHVSIPDVIDSMLVTSIGEYAFHYCPTITSVTISDGVRNIGDAAFRDCISMTNVNIPDYVNSIGTLAFADCNSLTTIDVSPDNAVFASVDGVLYDKGIHTMLQFPGGKVTALIPASVTTIDFNAFYHCPSLTSITVNPNNMNFAIGKLHKQS